MISRIRSTEEISSPRHFSEVLFTTCDQVSKDFLGDRFNKPFSSGLTGFSGLPAQLTVVICSGLNQIIISPNSLFRVHDKIPDAISLYFLAGECISDKRWV
ncbi:hypothetical protein D3C85_997430 [compost metagenome]